MKGLKGIRIGDDASEFGWHLFRDLDAHQGTNSPMSIMEILEVGEWERGDDVGVKYVDLVRWAFEDRISEMV